MMELGSFWLLRPNWLLALPVLLAVYFFFRHQQRAGFGVWRNIMDADMSAFAERAGYIRHAKNAGMIPILLIAMALIVCALAGLAKRDNNALTFRNVDTLAIAIDMSDSVTQGKGLGLIQAVAKRLLDTADGRPVALVLFASQSYLVAAPSLEPESAASIISVLDEKLMPDEGSRPDRALQTINQMIALSGAQNADIVVISDGGGVGAEAGHEAELLRRKLGARVFAVYAPPPIPAYGAPPASRAELEDLVERGGGRIADIEDTEPLIDHLRRSARLAPRNAALNSLLFHEYGRWILFAVLPFVLLLFRRKAAT